MPRHGCRRTSSAFNRSSQPYPRSRLASRAIQRLQGGPPCLGVRDGDGMVAVCKGDSSHPLHLQVLVGDAEVVFGPHLLLPDICVVRMSMDGFHQAENVLGINDGAEPTRLVKFVS